jgi:hypothetical protein
MTKYQAWSPMLGHWLSAETEEFEWVHIVPALGTTDCFHCSLISTAWKMRFDNSGRLQIDQSGDFNSSKSPIRKADVAPFIALKFLIHFPEDLQWIGKPHAGLVKPYGLESAPAARSGR